MVPPKPALWALLLALLRISTVPAQLRTCSVPDVLRHYQAVISEDLQAAEHSILVSIESLGRTLRRAVAGGPRGALEKAAWTVALRTEAVMRRHCRTLRQGRRRPRAQGRPHRRGRRGRRRFLRRALDAAATCWEKLFALRASAGEGP